MSKVLVAPSVIAFALAIAALPGHPAAAQSDAPVAHSASQAGGADIEARQAWVRGAIDRFLSDTPPPAESGRSSHTDQ